MEMLGATLFAIVAVGMLYATYRIIVKVKDDDDD